jgi:CheY-like chemotaxis protein
MATAECTQAVRIAPEIAATLAGARVGLIGFEPEQAVRISAVLQRARLVATHFDATWLGGPARLGDLLIVKLGALSADALRAAAASAVPVLIAGSSDALLEGAAGAYSWARDLLPEPWSDSDLLVRLFRLLAPERACPAPSERLQPLILIADDDPAWIALVEVALRTHGLAFQVATDGLTALRFARRLQPDLLILDVRMPGMNGFEVLETIRREPLLTHLPVALLTGCDDAAEVARGSQLGADDYLVKPLGPTVLLNRIKRLLSAASGRQEPQGRYVSPRSSLMESVPSASGA